MEEVKGRERGREDERTFSSTSVRELFKMFSSPANISSSSVISEGEGVRGEG